MPIQDYLERMALRPSVQKVLADRRENMAKFMAINQLGDTLFQ